MAESLEALQEYVWDLLPQKKHSVGKEVVFDLVSMAAQEWPECELEKTRSGDTEELGATWSLCKSMKRHCQLIYGERKFTSLWLVALEILIPIVIDILLKWWRRKERHRKLLRFWRRNWANG